LFHIHDYCGAQDRSSKRSGSEGRRELLLSEHWSEIMRVHLGIILFAFFGIDVPASSKAIGFGTKFPWTETNYEMELVEVLRPAGLSSRQEFGGCEILEVLVVGHYIDGRA
jgi:hypothetical protein